MMMGPRRPLPELAQQVWQARRPPALPGAVRVSADGPPDADHEYLLKLRSVNLRRLQHLELQRAHFGSHTPAYIQVEIEDTDAEIKRAITKGISKDGSHLAPPMAFASSAIRSPSVPRRLSASSTTSGPWKPWRRASVWPRSR